jgi:predicted RNA polymerase sigma factor
VSERSRLNGDTASPPGLVDHYFRHEYGRLVAVLVRRVGLHQLEAVEDAVQGALLAALTAWLADGLPHDPGAWLYRVAHNHLLGALRKEQGHQRVIDGLGPPDAQEGEVPVPPAFAGEVRDELLRLLFVCCDDLHHRAGNAKAAQGHRAQAAMACRRCASGVELARFSVEDGRPWEVGSQSKRLSLPRPRSRGINWLAPV